MMKMDVGVSAYLPIDLSKFRSAKDEDKVIHVSIIPCPEGARLADAGHINDLPLSFLMETASARPNELIQQSILFEWKPPQTMKEQLFETAEAAGQALAKKREALEAASKKT